MWGFSCGYASDYIEKLMRYLTQQEIEKLTPEEYSNFLSYCQIVEVDDDEITEESFRKMNKIYDV